MKKEYKQALVQNTHENLVNRLDMFGQEIGSYCEGRLTLPSAILINTLVLDLRNIAKDLEVLEKVRK